MLKPAETGTFLCLAQDQRTAKQVLDYVEDNFKRSKILKSRFVRRTSDTIELTNNITVEVRSANSARLRGLTYIGCVADELAHWFTDEGYANPDTQVLGAVRPAMLTTNGMLFMASSPWGRRGVLWDTFNKHFGPKGKPNILVARGTTVQFNPNIAQETIDAELERDPELNCAEYLAEFRSRSGSVCSPGSGRGAASVADGSSASLRSARPTLRSTIRATGQWRGLLGAMHRSRAAQQPNNATIDLLREWRPPFRRKR